MKIIIVGASGNVGHATALKLLELGNKLLVLARNAAKVADLVACGAVHVSAGATNLTAMQQVCRDADALLWLTPPAFSVPKLAYWYRGPIIRFRQRPSVSWSLTLVLTRRLSWR